MHQESVPRLVSFVYEAFGAQCAALLMAGLGEDPSRVGKKFYMQEGEVDGGRQWEIGVVSNSLPCRSEPLVLAALLKILLQSEGTPSLLEFQMSEVLDELLLAGVALTPGTADRIISKYVALFYDKRPSGGGESDEAGGGMYSLVTAYLKGSVNEDRRIGPARVSNSVTFDQSFVEGLRRGEVTFAGIRFGRLRRNLT